MEKWRSKGRPKNDGSVLPPTKRSSSRNSSTKDKKKERKWSFGGLLRRISSGQRNESSSNDEDITYIPGHMLAKKHTKRVSKMRSKLGKTSRGDTLDGENVATEEINYGSESTFIAEANERSRSPDTNDLVNSPSSDGSLDAPGRHSRISAMKARAEAKRVRLCGDSSSDDNDEVDDNDEDNDDDDNNSHRSSQTSMKFRHEQDVATQRNVQRTDSWSRRTRGARTERYIKRMSRDDCSNGAIDDNRVRKGTNALPTSYEQSTNQTDFNVRREMDSPRITSPTGREHVRSRGYVDGEKDRRANIDDESLYESRAFDGKRDTQECDKFTWPKTNLRRTKAGEDVYGSLKAGQWTAYEEVIQERKVLPPEPPPRSSKSRIFSNITKPTFVRYAVKEQPLHRGYCEPTRRDEAERSCMSDNDIIHDYRASGLSPTSFPNEQSYPRANTSYNSLDRTYGKNNESLSSRMKRENHENATSSFVKQSARITRSLPKGVELFSRQEVANRPVKEYKLSDSLRRRIDEKSNDQPIPRPRTTRNESNNPSNETKKIRDENEAERKRSSRNLQEALFELETIYNSLRLSDPDLLDRAEERTMNEYRDNAAKNLTVRSLISNAEVSSSNDDHDFVTVDGTRTDTNLRIEDDMAYRRMNPKERPSSVNGQSSLSCISYLATSPNLSIRDNERTIRPRSGRSSPDLTRDDLLFRSISHAMNTLKIIEPQPPFGIPLGPVTGSNESDYLHVKPSTTKHGQTRSLYIPKSEPDVVSDDLAFRNLRKDNTTLTNNNTCYYMQMDASIEPRTNTKYDTSSLGGVTRKKHAVRSNTTVLNGSKMLNNDWYNEYLRTSQKLSFTPDELNDTLNNSNATNDATASSYKTTGRARDHRNNGDLDINGNQSKFGLQRKIQVYVPREYSSCDNEKYIADNDVKFHNDKSNDESRKLIIAEYENLADFCDSRNSSTLDVAQCDNENDENIEQFTEQEISEYAQLCRDLEKLLRQTTANDETKKEDELVDIEAEKLENDSQSEFDEWERLFNEDYEISSSTLNFNEDSAIACNERDDDRSSSRSAGLSSENLPNLARKRIDKFGDDDLLSSASDVGACSNNGSLPDSVYEKFDRLLREVNDLPLVECTNKINEHATTIASNSGNNVSVLEREASPRVTEVDWESRKTKGEIRGTLNDTLQLFENPSLVVSPKNPSVDRPVTSNLENLKSLTRRMRNEEIACEARATISHTHEHEERTENKDAINDEKDFLEGTNARPRSLDLSDESSIQRDEFEKLVNDALSSSPPIDLSICSDNESSTDSVYDKFNQLLREVNVFPVVECVGKIHENVSSKLVEDDDETSDAAREPVSRQSRINVSSLMRHPEDSRENLERTDNLKRRYGKNVDKSNETHDTMLEGKTRLEVRTDVPNEALISREDQLTACYHGDLQRDTCFTLATTTALPVDINISKNSAVQ